MGESMMEVTAYHMDADMDVTCNHTDGQRAFVLAGSHTILTTMCGRLSHPSSARQRRYATPFKPAPRNLWVVVVVVARITMMSESWLWQ
jgi:hypothetical protein